MVKEHYDKHQLKKIDDRHWRMYVFKEFGEMYQMRKDMYILYEIQFEVCYITCFQSMQLTTLVLCIPLDPTHACIKLP